MIMETTKIERNKAGMITRITGQNWKCEDCGKEASIENWQLKDGLDVNTHFCLACAQAKNLIRAFRI